MAKIYTRTGDAGQTGLIGGPRVPKDDIRIAAIGDVDELNAAIGFARATLADSDLQGTLAQIQNRLFDIGAELANPGPSKPALTEADVRSLERSIDSMSTRLPPLKAFILPGGSPGAAALHLVRTVCRRAERSVISFHSHNSVAESVRAYLNRLSDWLFLAARTANAAANVPDVEWHAQGKE